MARSLRTREELTLLDRRPRRAQADQRPQRPRGGRPGPAHARGRAAGVDPGDRRRLPARRRRVRASSFRAPSAEDAIKVAERAQETLAEIGRGQYSFSGGIARVTPRSRRRRTSTARPTSPPTVRRRPAARARCSPSSRSGRRGACPRNRARRGADSGEPAVLEVEPVVGVLDQERVVGRADDRGAGLPREVEQEPATRRARSPGRVAPSARRRGGAPAGLRPRARRPHARCWPLERSDTRRPAPPRDRRPPATRPPAPGPRPPSTPRSERPSSTFSVGGEEGDEPRLLADERDVLRPEARPRVAVERRHRLPRTCTSPRRRDRSRPARRWRSVVFPEPDGPVTAVRRPAGEDGVERD